MASLAPGSRSLVGGWMDRSHFQILTPADLKNLWPWRHLIRVMRRHDRSDGETWPDQSVFSKSVRFRKFLGKLDSNLFTVKLPHLLSFLLSLFEKHFQKVFLLCFGKCIIISPPFVITRLTLAETLQEKLEKCCLASNLTTAFECHFLFWKYCKILCPF